jgi:hypothetical protein
MNENLNRDVGQLREAREPPGDCPECQSPGSVLWDHCAVCGVEVGEDFGALTFRRADPHGI